MSTPQSDRNPEPTSRRAASHGAKRRRHHGKAESAGSTGTDATQVLLVVLVILALAASVVMQFTDSSAALKLALLAALWAAIIGFFLVSRYRRQVQRSREQLDYEQRLHRSELREAQARAETANAQAQQSGGLSDEDIAILSEIRAGLDEVRSKLEDLQGHVFEYEPAALRAQAWRLQELEESAEASVPAFSAPEKTGHISGAPSLDAVAGRLGHSDQREEPARSISPELAHLLESGEGVYRGSHRAGEPGGAEPTHEEEPRGRHEAAPLRPSAEDTAEIKAVSSEETEPGVGGVDSPEERAETRRGRRRADGRSGGLSVAELMANMNRGEK